MTLQVFQDRVLMHVGPAPVTETMVTSTAVSAALLALAVAARWSVAGRPASPAAVVATMTVRWLDGLVMDVVGRSEPVLASMAGALFLFIAGCNVAGQLPGVRPATASLATTSALAAIVFLAVPVAGVATHGLWGYIKHYFQPNPLLMPLHVISEFSRTVALSVRLFGNIMSGHLIVGLLVALAGFLVPMPLMALDLLIGLLQAYIFTVLAVVYIGAAIGAGDET